MGSTKKKLPSWTTFKTLTPDPYNKLGGFHHQVLPRTTIYDKADVILEACAPQRYLLFSPLR